MKRLNGIRLPFRKDTELKPAEPIKLPKNVRIPMKMHAGIACTPIVAVGDSVFVGQMIGDSDAKESAPIHSSVSGTVTAISEIRLPDGEIVPCVEIKADGKQILDSSCHAPKFENKEAFIAAVRQSGCVGMSGAGVPTHLKLAADDNFEMLIVNGAECDPYLSADSRLMVEAAEDVLGGIRLVMEQLQIPEARIGIMRDKPVALKAISDACAEEKNITVCALPAMYPQGAEKVVIFHTCGRIVSEHQTAADQHVLVLNVSTLAFLCQYAKTGIPLIERVVTVSGTAVRYPCNLRVPVGTPAMNLLEDASCDLEALKTLICGGMMMGDCLNDLNFPVLRQQNGLIAMRSMKQPERTACIRCGRCMRACPMNLMPMKLEEAYLRQDLDLLRKYRVSLCMDCGACSYVCPAHRPLAETNLLAKEMLPELQKGDAS